MNTLAPKNAHLSRKNSQLESKLLSQEQIDLFNQQGFLQVENLLTADEVDMYRQLYERFLANEIDTTAYRSDLGGHAKTDSAKKAELITQIMVPSLLAVATFSALMWPCIFAPAIRGLGKYRQQSSSLLIMMIVGGDILPPLQGLLSDQSGIGIHRSFIVPPLAYAYIARFAFRVGRKE